MKTEWHSNTVWGGGGVPGSFLGPDMSVCPWTLYSYYCVCVN
jgi:hypothetical protein